MQIIVLDIMNEQLALLCIQNTILVKLLQLIPTVPLCNLATSTKLDPLCKVCRGIRYHDLILRYHD